VDYEVAARRPALECAFARPYAPIRIVELDAYQVDHAYVVLHYEIGAPPEANFTPPMLALLTMVQSMADVRISKPLAILLPTAGSHPLPSSPLSRLLRFCAAAAAASRSGFRCDAVRAPVLELPFTPTKAQQQATRADLARYVVSKLLAFSMKAKSVVLLDSDQLFVKNTDAIFEAAAWQAGGPDGERFCRHIKSIRGGANWMHIRPSAHTFASLMRAIAVKGNSSAVSFHAPEQDLLGAVCPVIRKEDGPQHLDSSYSLPEFMCRRKGNASGLERAKVLHFLGGAKPWSLVPLTEFDPLCTNIGDSASCQTLVDKMVARRCYRRAEDARNLEKVWRRARSPPDANFLLDAYACCASFFSLWLQTYSKALRYLAQATKCTSFPRESARTLSVSL